MPPSPCLTICATPVFFSPPWVSLGHSTVSPLPSFHAVGAAATRYLVKLLVVPEPSERCATVIGLAGRVTPGLSAAITGSFQVLTSRWKILAMVSGLSWSLSTPDRLYEIVIGAATVGTYRYEPAATPSASLTVLSVPAKSVRPLPNSFLPVPEPTEL